MIEQAADMIRSSKYTVAFTGAGLSRESGLPLFSEWPEFDIRVLDINFFKNNYDWAWPRIKDWFYDFYGQAEPNEGHRILKQMEDNRWIRSVVTLNFDDLHQKAGSTNTIGICGSPQRLVCLDCHEKFEADQINWEQMPPRCPVCGGMLKPDILFYGDEVPDPEYKLGLKEANRAKVMLVVGVSGEMMPAGVIPMFAKKRRQTKIIEINIQPTHYTNAVTDIFIQKPASEGLNDLFLALKNNKS